MPVDRSRAGLPTVNGRDSATYSYDSDDTCCFGLAAWFCFLVRSANVQSIFLRRNKVSIIFHLLKSRDLLLVFQVNSTEQRSVNRSSVMLIDLDWSDCSDEIAHRYCCYIERSFICWIWATRLRQTLDGMDGRSLSRDDQLTADFCSSCTSSDGLHCWCFSVCCRFSTYVLVGGRWTTQLPVRSFSVTRAGVLTNTDGMFDRLYRVHFSQRDLLKYFYFRRRQASTSSSIDIGYSLLPSSSFA